VATISRRAEAAVLASGVPPPLAPEEAARSARLSACISARIADAGGWLPFSAFMRVALYEPELGYYMGGRPLFGAAGDFVTAPELSPIFAACLANGIADLLERTGGGDVVELGAGSGVAALQVFGSLLRRGAPLLRYRIVEPSRALAERQRSCLADSPATAGHLQRFEWLDAPPCEPWQGVAFANEVVDALPVERFRVLADGAEAIGVVASAAGFGWDPRPAGPALQDAVAALQGRLATPMAAGYVSELRLGLRDWLDAVVVPLTRGAVLVADYGLPRSQYYHPSRDGGTLCGFRRHWRIADALATPGAQDITAWVDFSALADAARAAGLEVAGFSTQAHYLLETGIERELAGITASADERDRLRHRRDAATLLLPGEMGERFKVMALSRGLGGPFAGFDFRDLRPSL
jgi:SAM-dependent MidA family methyltransferase